MIFVTSALGITLTDSHLCHNLTDLHSIPFWSISNSVFTLPDITFFTISLLNQSSFWCDLSIGMSISFWVRPQVDVRWWTSAMTFLMPSSMPMTVGLFLSLGSVYKFFCFNLDMASATTFFLPAMCLNTILYSFNSSAHLSRVGFSCSLRRMVLKAYNHSVGSTMLLLGRTEISGLTSRLYMLLSSWHYSFAEQHLSNLKNMQLVLIVLDPLFQLDVKCPNNSSGMHL